MTKQEKLQQLKNLEIDRQKKEDDLIKYNDAIDANERKLLKNINYNKNNEFENIQLGKKENEEDKQNREEKNLQKIEDDKNKILLKRTSEKLSKAQLKQITKNKLLEGKKKKLFDKNQNENQKLYDAEFIKVHTN